MNREEIISKGFYKHPQLENFISAKQFIVLKKNGKKYLLLRMQNSHNEAVTGFSLCIRQYDGKGGFIATERVDVEEINQAPDSVFNISQEIALRNECVDFEVDVVAMTFGKYEFLVKGGEVLPVFSLDVKEKKIADKAEMAYKMRKGNHTLKKRNHISPKIFVVLSSIIFLFVCLLAVIQVVNFTRTETLFTLDNIKYSFETDNRVDGPIRVEGYTGFAGNIIIPESIEGHKVARISKEAFANSLLNSVVIQGETVIEERAFLNCQFLRSVELEKAVSIGDYAFYSCKDLKTVSISGNTSTLGVGAFGKCTSLKEVKLPDSFTEIKAYAFIECTGLECLEIPDSVQTIGEGIVAGCTRLKTLRLPFVGFNMETAHTLDYVFRYNDKVSATKALLKLTLGQSKTVYPETFAECSYLERISFESDLAQIGERAFYNCKNLIAVDFSDSTATVGEGAFENCLSLRSICLNGVIEIKSFAFSNCTELVEVTVSDSLTSIGEGAFKNCKILRVLHLPATVRELSQGAFEGCYSLWEITVPFLGVEENMPSPLTTWFGSTTIALKSITVIRGGVLPADAFKNCVNLEKVTLPDSMTTIGENAFLNCVSLKKFEIPMGVSSIGNQAFKGCASLENINISNKVSEIKSGVFQDCTSLRQVTLPDTVKTIDSYAFSGCASLKKFKLPANVSVISEGMLSGCVALESISFSSVLDTIESNAFYGCEKLAAVYLPESLKVLDNEAFRGCSLLREINLPRDVRTIGQGAFAECNSLETLKIPDLKKNEMEYTQLSYFFLLEGEDCAIPESLTSLELTNASLIKNQALADCVNIKNILLPDSLEIIESYAFKNCSSLESLIIPEDVFRIEQNAFYGCTALKELEVPFLDKDNGGVSFWFDNVPKSLECITVTNSTAIPSYAFSDCVYLKEVVFDCEIETIGTRAFYNCHSLKNIELPESLLFVGADAFEGCYRLYEVTNNSNVKFSKDEDSTRLYDYILCLYEDGEVPNKAYSNGFELLLADDGNWYLIGYNGSNTDWVLPENFSEYIIADYVFYDNETVESVSIPWTAVRFGKNMFAYCKNLKSVSFLKNITAYAIPEGAFMSCSNLERIELPSVINQIGTKAFEGCGNLLQVSLPSNIDGNYIASDAFKDCFNMFEVVYSGYLRIEAGKDSHGYVAKYAMRVGANASLQTETVSYKGNSFKFARVFNEWYLYRIDVGDGTSDIIDLPETLEFCKQYSVNKNALCIEGYDKFVIPACVKAISDGSLEKISAESSVVYYCKTLDDWKALAPDSEATVYFYVKCVHKSNQWTYDADGYITAEINPKVMENISEATCSKDGQINIVCLACGEILETAIASKLDHSFDGSGVCTSCGKTR